MSRFFVAAMAMGLSACTMQMSFNVDASQKAKVPDTTPPSIPGLVLQTPSVSPGNVATPTFEVSLTGGDSFLITDTIEIFDGANCVGNTVGRATGISGTSTTLMVSSQAEGSHHYSVLVSDAAGNASCSSSNATSALQDVTYLYDGTGPTWSNSVALAAVLFSSLSKTPPITFTADADDGAGTGVMGYQYALGTTSGADDVVAWTALSGGQAPTTSTQVTGLSLTKGNTYYYSMRAFDNVQNASTVYTQSFVADSSFYNNGSAIVINNGALYTNSSSVILSFSQLKNAQDVYITQTAGCASGGSWQSVKTQLPWTLVYSNQLNTVYAKFRSSGGEESDCVSDSITHDDIAPGAPAFVSFDSVTPGSSTTPKVIGTVDSDAQRVRLFVKSTCAVSIGEGTASDFASGGVGLNSAMLPGSQIDIYAKAIDVAGNVSSSCAYLSTYQNNASLSSDTWSAMVSTSNAGGPPSWRVSASAVWTGSKMIVWGGTNGNSLNSGSLYDPANDAWQSTSMTNVPEARSDHSAVWTGTEMIVWGGYNDTDGYLNSGGRYDALADSWTAMSSAGAPVGRVSHSAVWTGKEMIVWGGIDASYASINSGGRYDLASDSWSAVNSTGAPSIRSSLTAVWTGTEMIVWGGYSGGAYGGGIYLDSGARYNPVIDTWASVSSTNTPAGRRLHSAVWTGTEMIVWGGYDGTVNLNSGARYDPVADVWTATSMTNVPSALASQSSVWTGAKMIVLCGSNSGVITGGLYDPSTDTWLATSTTSAPVNRNSNTTVWTGTEMIVWGGSGAQITGGRYNPTSDSWISTSLGTVPLGRAYHTAVWTSTEMIVWGGRDTSSTFVNTGSRYDPVTDTWTATSTAGSVPQARYSHTAVWTGSKMIVWGGTGNSGSLNTGGVYNPSSDTWSATSTTNAPTARVAHTAVWTGSKMIVWGGGSGLSTGGLYDPSNDTWTATSTTSAPTARYGHSAVWTGSSMIIWGGYKFNTYSNTGGIYDPLNDIWVATSITNAPTARRYHSAVWIGTKMIVWGGGTTSSVNTGGVYDLTGDTWTSTSITNAPTARSNHSAIGTNSKMIVWGGGTNTGGVYDVTGDTWTATSTVSAPSTRSNSSAVWTGTEMIIWGGFLSSTYYNTGARYIP